MAFRDETGADNLVQAHAAFKADLDKLEASVRSASGASLEEVQAELGAVRAHAAEHFHLEEQSEWVDKVRKRGPNRERLVLRLGQEHRELLDAINTLLELVQVARNLDEGLREKVHRWIERVRRHESTEDDLIQEAYTLDLGAAD